MSQRLTESNIADCQTKFNLTYHVSYAYICQQLVGFEGKDVLEVGGSLPKDFVFDYLNVKSWSAIETPDYEAALKEVGGLIHEGTIIPELNDYSDLGFFNRKSDQYNFFLANIEDLPSEYYSKYDLVFSLAAFEHIHKFPLALEKMFLALKPGGQLFSMFSPIWSAFDGHHLPKITDKQGNSFEFSNSPIPPWGHLLMRPGELSQYLYQFTDKETAHLITYYVYNSPHINRFFTEDYIEFIEQSSFKVKTLELTFSTSIEKETQLTLEKLHPGRTYFKNNGILVVLEKPESERTNSTSSATVVKSVTSDEAPVSDTEPMPAQAVAKESVIQEAIVTQLNANKNSEVLSLLEEAQKVWEQGRFREATKLYRNLLIEKPELARIGFNINLAHSIILSTDWREISSILPQEINYLESSGWLNSLRLAKPVNNESKPVPWYTYPAIEFIENKLKINYRVFEFGSGNSTLWFSQKTQQVVSVENNPEWFAYIQQNMPDNVDLYLIEDEYKYASKVLEYPEEYFDILVIDGVNRNKCAEYGSSKIKKNGFIIFDNTDNQDYDDGVKFLYERGFKRIDFYGLVPSYTYKNCTSLFFTNDEFLSQNNLPSNKQSCLGQSCFQIMNPQVKTVDNTLVDFEQYQQAPTNQSALTMFADLDNNPSSSFNQSSITNLVQEREQLTYQLLNLSEDQLISAYLGDLGEAHKRLLSSDIKDRVLTEAEQAFVNEILGKQCEGIEIPTWEYLPEGWNAKDSSLKGWNVQNILDIRKANWSYFLELTQSTIPLGENYTAHNTYMTYAYVLALATRKKDCISLLDWGGGVGDYYLISKALLPEIQIDYHCKEVPLLCQGGRELLPEANFYENEEECFRRSYDLILSSGSLQYFEDWKRVTQQLASVTSSYLFITRLPVVHQAPSFVVVQRPYNFGYQTEYMGWFLNREEFLNYMNGLDMELVREFLIAENFPVPGAPEPGEGRGFLFRPRTGGDEA